MDGRVTGPSESVECQCDDAFAAIDDRITHAGCLAQQVFGVELRGRDLRAQERGVAGPRREPILWLLGGGALATHGGWRQGVGITGVRGRAAELGGSCDIGPASHGGAVRVRLPLVHA